jgi:hypothetical protein
MIDNATPIATLIERAEDYTKTTFDLFKQKAIDQSSEVVSSIALQLTIIITVALSILIINIGLALWVGKLLGNGIYGFFIMGGFYALVAILLSIFGQQWIKIPVSNSIIKMLKKKRI